MLWWLFVWAHRQFHVLSASVMIDIITRKGRNFFFHNVVLEYMAHAIVYVIK